MLNEIQIQNFRGIKDLKISNFSKVNIFVGKANVGKTSILEALYVYLVEHSIPKILDFRQLTIDEDCFQGFFYDYDASKEILLKGSINRKQILLRIHCKNSLEYVNVSFPSLPQNFDIPKHSKGINNLVFEYFDKTHNNDNTIKPIKTMAINKLFPNPNQIQFQASLINQSEISKPLNLNAVEFIGQNSFYENILRENLEEVISKKQKKGKLINELQKISEDIQDILFLRNNKLAIQKNNLDNSINLKLMGQGFQKYFAVLTSILNENKYILIDEIENSLHFEALEILIRFLLLGTEDDVQFFITTHNQELLEKLSEILNKEREKVSVFNVYENENNINVIRYSQKEFIFNIRQENEIRD